MNSNTVVCMCNWVFLFDRRAAAADRASSRTLAGLLELVGELDRVLQVHVVVDRAVDQQQLAVQVLRREARRALR